MHAADAGKVMKPMQCRGQVEGGVAQALGATLFENVRIDARGEVETADATGVRFTQVPLTGTGCGRRYGTRDLDVTPTRCSRRPRGWCRCR